MKASENRRICVVIPTYNNDSTIVDVIERVLKVTPDLIVVDDGSTDQTPELLKNLVAEKTGQSQAAERHNSFSVVTHSKNQGKGNAILTGFVVAKSKGFDCVITIDADGQHFPEDLPLFFEEVNRNPDAILIGCRNLNQENMNGQSKFANKFSNFWFTVQTGLKLTDTQTGYRLYPLDRLYGLKFITSRYESELELLVYAAWHDVDIKQIPVNVYYPKPEDRVSHFRPGYDFFRISVLNTILCFVAVFYGYPCKLINRLRKKK